MGVNKVRSVHLTADEFLVGVAGMRGLEIGVYCVLNFLMYSSGGPVHEADERIFGIIKDSPNALRPAIDRLVARGKLSRNADGFLFKTRVGLELDKAERRITKAQDNGVTGGRPRTKGKEKQRGKKPTGLNSEKLSTSTSTSTTDSVSPDGDTGASAPKGPVDEKEALKVRLWGPALEWFCKAAQTPEKKARPLLGRWVKDHGEGAVLKALIEAQRNSPLAPVPYITKILGNAHAAGHSATRWSDIDETGGDGAGGMGQGPSDPAFRGTTINGDYSVVGEAGTGAAAGGGRGDHRDQKVPGRLRHEKREPAGGAAGVSGSPGPDAARPDPARGAAVSDGVEVGKPDSAAGGPDRPG